MVETYRRVPVLRSNTQIEFFSILLEDGVAVCLPGSPTARRSADPLDGCRLQFRASKIGLFLRRLFNSAVDKGGNFRGTHCCCCRIPTMISVERQ